MPTTSRRLALLLVLCLGPVAAALPPVEAPRVVLGHTGRLLDANDAGVEGQVSLKFTIYREFEAPHGGTDTVLWTETRTATLFHGIYQLALGDTAAGGTALTLDALGDGSAERWLGVTVGTTELTPRMLVGRVPWALAALRATRAGGADSADALHCAGCVTASELAAGAVGTAQLAAHAVTAATLADGSVGSLQLAFGAVSADALGTGAVTSSKLGTSSVTADALAAGAVTSGSVLAGAIGTDALANGSVTLEKLAGRDAATGLVTGLNAERLGGKSAADVAAMADSSAAIATALKLFSGVQRACAGGVQSFDGAAWGACQAQKWNCISTPNHAGCTTSSSYANCAAVLADALFAGGDGAYFIDPDGAGGAAPFPVWCDMTTDGGGWTMVMKLAGDSTLNWAATQWTTTATLNETDLSFSADANAKYPSFNTVAGTALMYYRPGVGSTMKYVFADSRTPLYRFQNGSTYGSLGGLWRAVESTNNTSNAHCNTFVSQGHGVNYAQSCDGNAGYSRARLGEGYEQYAAAHCVWGLGTYNSPCVLPSSGAGAPGGNTRFFVR